MRKIVLAILRLCYKIGPNDKNPPKIRFEKIVKLKDHSYVCKSLINFPYKTYTLNDWKRKLCLSAETCLEKNSWNHNLQVNLFSADFSHLEPLCATLYRTEPCIYILLSIFFHRLFRLLSPKPSRKIRTLLGHLLDGRRTILALKRLGLDYILLGIKLFCFSR